MNTIGSFILVKNEAAWIGPHIMSWVSYLDQMVFFDGNSTDGTLEIIERIKSECKFQAHKIIVVKDRDPKDLQQDYVKLFDKALHMLTTDFAFFLHPDMFHVKGGDNLKNLDGANAFTTSMESYAGDPGGPLFKIASGRMAPWKNIMRLNNPDLGLHYHGHYGSADEDMYFKEITGDSHDHYGPDMHLYPYSVKDSGVKIAHFSDVRPIERRIDRMEKCLLNQGYRKADAKRLAKTHPRVTFLDDSGFKFELSDYPDKFKHWDKYFKTRRHQ